MIAMGEGGGQVLRTSLGLSAHTGLAFEIHNIRIKRKNPGLGRQHLTAVRAAAAICDAEISGDEVGSTRLRFVPKAVKAGPYHFAVGTAGSANLVFQTILPALMLANGPSTVVFEGGTHNSAAPPFHFIERVFLPLLARMGVQVAVQLEVVLWPPSVPLVLCSRSSCTSVASWDGSIRRWFAPTCLVVWRAGSSRWSLRAWACRLAWVRCCS